MNGPQVVPIACPCGCGATLSWSARCCSFRGIQQETAVEAGADLAGHLAHAHGITPTTAPGDPT